MPTKKADKSLIQALAQLHSQRVRLEGAIARLEGALSQPAKAGPGARRASGPARMARVKTARVLVITCKPRSRKGWTPAARKAAAERMRNYWANEAKLTDKKPRAKKASKRAAKSQAAQGARRSTTGWTDSARSAVGERMRNYWAQRRAEKLVTG